MPLTALALSNVVWCVTGISIGVQVLLLVAFLTLKSRRDRIGPWFERVTWITFSIWGVGVALCLYAIYTGQIT